MQRSTVSAVGVTTTTESVHVEVVSSVIHWYDTPFSATTVSGKVPAQRSVGPASDGEADGYSSVSVLTMVSAQLPPPRYEISITSYVPGVVYTVLPL